MKFIINGDQEFEAANLERVTGGLALDLPKQAGIGLQTLARRIEEMDRLAFDESGAVVVLSPAEVETPEGAARVDAEAVLDSEPHLRALLAFLWVSRRLDGERSLTFEQACDFPITSMATVADEPEPAQDVEPDFPSPASAPDAADVA